MHKKYKRVFVIVADSMGIGDDPKAIEYNDLGTNTLVHISERVGGLNVPTMNSMGLGDLDNVIGTTKVNHPHAFSMKAKEQSNGKDTMIGHWEMMGVYTEKAFKRFDGHGFPQELMDELSKRTGHKLIGNYAASGTEILKVLGEEQMRDNSLIVYTSGDSVLQIAAHEEVTGLQELYRCCDIARELCMKPEWMVGRIIARPYLGDCASNFKRTANRHDLSLKPPVDTAMNILNDNGYMVSCVGKINDIFSGSGVTRTYKTKSNDDGMNKTISEAATSDFEGLCFVNLVEFDSEYGHRRNVEGYAKCIEDFDIKLKELIEVLKDDDLLVVTADHGNDPTWTGTDHTREKVPVLIYSKSIVDGKKLEERNSFADIGATILENFGLEKPDYLIGEPIVELLK